MRKDECRRIAEDVVAILKENGYVRDDVIGIEEVAEILGVTPKTVRNRIKEIPHKKVFGRLRFYRSSIYKMLKDD